MPHPVDLFVGNRLRQRRWMLGMTQQQLAEKVGIKFQQIQKYENGINRISASRLWDLALVLGVGIEFFYDGLDDAAARTHANDPSHPNGREVADLMQLYVSLPEPKRRRLFELARVLGDPA
jgi:transcriptional regulator with XRE-family HTH domain